jgi:hypothetical protein
MTRQIFRRALGLGVSLGMLASITSCAQEREPVNRVQPNALDKTFFLGENLADKSDDPEFYWRGYVIDGSANQSAIGVGSWSHVDRIRWEVSENMLIARKSYELFDETNPPGDYAGPDSVGTVVAAYQITSHFDIRRAYNSSTGEEMNVIEENTSDRPWYERRFMRVDWSTNMVNDPMWADMFLGKVFGEISVSPLTYNVTDPASKDAPHFETEDGYFDITNRFYIEPEMTTMWGWQFPTCWLVGVFTGSSTFECDAQEATVRFSFKKIDPNDDFEPLENSRASLDVVGNPGGLGDSYSVGIVTAPRMGFDPAYGFVDKNFKRFANIHNIWKRSHQEVACNAKYDNDGNGTDDQCENAITGYAGAQGSQCDVHTKKCTIPYRDRQIKTIGYWVNDLMPAEFQDTVDGAGQRVKRGAAEEVVYSWNQMMANSAAYAREAECRRTGGDRDGCHNQFFGPDKEMVALGGWLTDRALDPTPVVTICHNPVRDYDIHEVCGETGYQARTGDIRRNMLVYWPYDSRAPWGGIADWNGDPLTGQIIGGMALTMGRSVTYGAAFARDVLQVAMGDITLEQLISGVPQEMYFTPGIINNQAIKPSALTAEEINKRIAAVDAKNAMQVMGIKPLFGNTMQEKMASFSTMKASMMFDPTSESAAVSGFDALVAPFLGTDLESNLVTPSWLRGSVGYGPNATATPDIMNLASPLRMLDPDKQRILEDTIRTRLEAKGACFLDSDAPMVGSIDIPGLATYFKNKYGDLTPEERGRKIYEDLLPETFKGIQLHEMGHSLGMLHQFASSWDAPNYNPQYWQLRTNEGQAAGSCNGTPRDPSQPDTCMGPRYLDPETADENGMAEESRPGILYFASTSTMEYQWERFGESAGLGTYDQMAMNALYGRVLETFDDRVIPVEEQIKFAPRMKSQLDEADMVTQTTKYGTFPQPMHYTELARQMKVFDPARDCRPATPEEIEVAKWRIVHGKVCAPTPRDHVAWQDMVSDPIDPNDPNSKAVAWHAKNNGNVRWFHRWGSTNNAYMHTNPSDAGADPYEAMVNTERKFIAMYPWTYFRRHNREFTYFRIPSAVSRTYHARARTYHWHAALRAAEYMRNFGETAYNEMAQSDDWLRPYLMASTESFNMLYRSVLMPQPGKYYPMSTRTVSGYQTSTPYDFDQYPQTPLAAFTLYLGEARYIDDEFNSGPDGGGSWDYLSWMNRSGFEVEKAYALGHITNGRPPVYTPTREYFLSPWANYASYYADMPTAVDRLLGGMFAEDWEAFAPHFIDNHLQWYDFTQPGDLPSRSAMARVIFPNVGYNQQGFGAILAALYSRDTGDMTLLNKMRIWIDGVDGTVGTTGFPDPQQQVRLYNPLTGYTYIARKFGPEMVGNKQVDKGIGSRMLIYANWIAANTFKVEKVNGKPDFDEFGQVKLILDANGQPQLTSADPSNTQYVRFVRYMGFIDAVRQIGVVLGGGPL